MLTLFYRERAQVIHSSEVVYNLKQTDLASKIISNIIVTFFLIICCHHKDT